MKKHNHSTSAMNTALDEIGHCSPSAFSHLAFLLPSSFHNYNVHCLHSRQAICFIIFCCHPLAIITMFIAYTVDIYNFLLSSSKRIPLAIIACCPLSHHAIISIAKRCSYNSPAQRSHPTHPTHPIPLIALKQERPMM